jgi:hypothetical protein
VTFPGNRVARLYPTHRVPFSSPITTSGLRWRYSYRLHTGSACSLNSIMLPQTVTRSVYEFGFRYPPRPMTKCLLLSDSCDFNFCPKAKVMLQPTVSRTVLCWCQALIWECDNFLFLIRWHSWVFDDLGRPVWLEDWSVVYGCCWVSPVQSFSGPSPAGLITIFYFLKFEAPPAWRARSQYLYPPEPG